ncbi:MAG: DUF4292 domain-containing protein [Bacteroidales bacterium]
MINLKSHSTQGLIGIILIIGTFTSCRSKMVNLNDYAAKKEIVDLFGKAPHFDAFQSQIQINTNGLSAKGDLRIIKNQAIYLSVQAFFGIEVARLKITPDSLIAIDRLHRRYFADTFAHIYGFNSQGINYYTIQSLFTNSIFTLGRDSLTLNDVTAFRWDKRGDETLLTSKKVENSKFLLNRNQQLTQTTLGDKDEKLKLTWSYSEFATFGQTSFPKTMQIDMISTKRKVQATLQFAKIDIDKPFQVECIIPSRYAKVDLNEILNILSGL